MFQVTSEFILRTILASNQDKLIQKFDIRHHQKKFELSENTSVVNTISKFCKLDSLTKHLKD